MIDDHAHDGSNRTPSPPMMAADDRLQAPFTFATVGAALGLALGFVEAALLRYLPRLTGLTQPDVRGAIWIIAPLADVPAGTLAGLLVGGIASFRSGRRLFWRRGCAAAGIGLATAYLGWLFFWFRIGVGRLVPVWLASVPPVLNLVLTPILYFLGGFAAAMLLFRRLGRRDGRSSHPVWRVPLAALELVSVAALALIIFSARGIPYSPPPVGGAPVTVPRNNVVLIMLDTVRADHLSCYGYRRITTPHLDTLARQGVLFEHAVAPTSWTLPSLASVLTGLLPHQHGAAWSRAMAPEPVTVAEVLKAQGYETAAFNANPQYGLAGWGLDKGFDLYVDGHAWLRHNLAATFVGQSLYQMLFREFVSFNEFDHLDAGQVNQQVLHWYAQRSGRPYFLFINYMDAHRPYVPPTGYNRRFGRIPKAVLWHISGALHDGRWSRPISPSERPDIINGYDNSLYYLDSQIGRLLDVLRASPDGERTFVIVAGDHGEGLGEHGSYDHGWDLYREVLRVPLLVSGPGVPAGQRVDKVAELRQLFSTVIEFALGKVGAPVEHASLSRFWGSVGGEDTAESVAVSELTPSLADHAGQGALSLCDARWHFLLDSKGHTQLFDWQNDPAETENLASSPALQGVVAQLRTQLSAVLAHSVSPWWQPGYLSRLDKPGRPLVKRALLNPESFPLVRQPIGTSQEFFRRRTSPPLARPNPSEDDLLRSIPYH